MTDTVVLRLLTVTLTHYPLSAANLRQISPHATFYFIYNASRVPRKVVTYDWSTKYEFLALFKFQPIKFALITSVVGIFYYKENESRTFVSRVKCK